MSYLATAAPFVSPDTPAGVAARKALTEGRLGDARLLSKAAQGGAARWLTDTGTPTGRVGAAVAAYVEQAQAVRQTPVLVPYAVPNRDDGSHSAGGYPTSGYMAWTVEIVEALRGSRAVVLLEPDSLLQATRAPVPQNRYALLRTAALAYKDAGAEVYLDAGSSNSFDWGPNSRADIAERLVASGVQEVAGFFTNVANFQTTAAEVAYGNRISELLSGARFVVDTSRNGAGALRGSDGVVWCNPPGRALGDLPRHVGKSAHVANLWVKTVGLSDGPCNGGPPAGTYWEDYLLGLAHRASWG